MIRLVAINDYGNQFYLDNVNIKGQNIVFNNDLEKKQIELYPNPNRGSFEIVSQYEKLDFEIYNAIGEKVQEGNLINNNKIILQDKSPGLYIIFLKSKDGRSSKKFSVY